MSSSEQQQTVNLPPPRSPVDRTELPPAANLPPSTLDHNIIPSIGNTSSAANNGAGSRRSPKHLVLLLVLPISVSRTVPRHSMVKEVLVIKMMSLQAPSMNSSCHSVKTSLPLFAPMNKPRDFVVKVRVLFMLLSVNLPSPSPPS